MNRRQFLDSTAVDLSNSTVEYPDGASLPDDRTPDRLRVEVL